MNSIKIQVQKRNAAQLNRFAKLSFVLGGLILLISVYEKYQTTGMSSGLFMAIYYSAYLIGGIINLAAGIFYQKILRNKNESIGRWLQLVTAFLLLLDSADKFINGKVLMPLALLFASMLYFLVAIYMPTLKSARYILLNDEHLIIRRSFFKRKIPLKKLSDVSYSPDEINLKLTNGKKIKVYPGKNDRCSLEEFIKRINIIKDVH